jgi:hypothetical protein
MDPTTRAIDRLSMPRPRRRPSTATVRATFRRLRAMGLDAIEAGNLTAYDRGIPPIEGGWTVKEIDRLLFVRYLVERRRLAS